MVPPSPDDAPLPPGWSRGFSNSQKRHYYCYEKIKHTQWHFPTVSEGADPLKAKRRAELNKSDGQKKRNVPEQQTGLGNIVGKLDVVSKQVQQNPSKRNKISATTNSGVNDSLVLVDSTSVAIIVPFRDMHPEQQRASHLQKFVPHMEQFLSKLVKQKLVSNYHVYIVNQSDDGRKFNRGKLLNIGFEYARSQKARNHDVFIFHDVDLLPQDDLGLWYAKFPKTPLHIARVWDRYSNNPKYMGGVVSFSSSDYKRINGYPNTFWGWGGEDDEMQKRCERLNMRWEYPDKGTLIDLEEMDINQKMAFLRNHKEWKNMVKWEALDEHEKTWKTNGLVNLNYSMLKKKSLSDTGHATMLTMDVKLNGNHWANDKCGVDFKGDWNKSSR